MYGNVDPSFREAALEAFRLGQIKTAPGVNINSDVSGIGGGYADGGAIYGGIPGKDSVPIVAMPGEHMFTAKEVQLMGGQDAVYKFRAGLTSGSSAQSLTGPAAAIAMFSPPQPLIMAGGGESGPSEMTGLLYLESGELLGKFSGIATATANKVIDQRQATAVSRRRGV